MNELTPIESEESFSPDQGDLEKSIISLNQLAMQNLEQRKPNHVLFYLNQGLLTSKQISNEEIRSRLLALTYNNLACYFQSIHSPDKALDFLFKAINLLSNSKDIINLSASHLNISSILSSMNQHERALRHALKCIYLLRNREKFSPTLIKAFLAAGNLYKTLKQVKDALECYEKGLALSRKHMGNNFTLTLLLRSALESLRSEPIPKQRTSKVLKKFTPILHHKARSGCEESLLKKLELGRNAARSMDRTRLFQEKMISTGRVMSSQRTRTKLSNVRETEASRTAALTSERTDQPKGLSHLDGFEEFKDLDGLKEFKEFRETKVVQESKDNHLSTDFSQHKPTHRSRAGDSKVRFDIGQQRMQEKLAAVLIQAWWKGVLARREFEKVKIAKQVLEAEVKAKLAAEYAQQLKIKAASILSPRKSNRIERTKLNSAALLIQKTFKSFKERQNFSKLKKKVFSVKSFLSMIINRDRILECKTKNV